MSPSFIAATAFAATSPTQSSAKATGFLITCDSAAATGFERILRVAPLGPAEMREQDDLAALAGYLGDGRCDAFEPGGVGDAAIFHGHVEVDAQQHALALHVDVIEGAECFGHCTVSLSCPAFECRRIRVLSGSWFASRRGVAGTSPAMTTTMIDQSNFPIATAVSDMRLEKPHSLSYHDNTRTSVPFCTLVWSMWKVEECGSWLKSIETLGAVV